MDRVQIWSTQQLVEFTSVVGSYADEAAAVHSALQFASEALEAEFGVVLFDDEVVTSVGFGRGGPQADVAAAKTCIDVPGIGSCEVLRAPFEPDGALVLLRAGDDAFTHEEVSLVGGMACMLSLALRNLRLLDLERALRADSERQAREALHDPLTGLPNRALFLDRLEHSLARACRDQTSIALLFLDMDHFKTVNDSLGHGAGDCLLAEVANRIIGCLRQADTAARLGGDEFAILLEYGSTTAEAAAVAERILATFLRHFNVGGLDVFANTSIGIALSNTATRDASDLLRNADVAMYRAKGEGGGRYAVFEPSMHAAVVARLELEADLRRALAGDEFVLHYQPIVALETGRPAGVEALVRWMHPKRGMVPPDRFIGLAEETGLIVPLGRWVLQQACTQARHFPAGITISVNLSRRQLQDRQLVDDVADAIALSGIDPSLLVLEITETVLMHDVDESRRTLHRLGELGVHLAIDDFGTGYSSLAYLKQFPVDNLKIDKSFVDGLNGAPADGALARAVVRLGHSLGYKVTAEGIETRQQLDELLNLRCDLGQGYYFSRPVPLDEAVAFVCSESFAMLLPSD